MLCGWVTSSRCFEGTYRLNLQGYDFVKAVHIFKTRETNCPDSKTTQKTCFSTITQGKTAITVVVLLCTYFRLFYLPHLLLGFDDARSLFSDLMKRLRFHNIWTSISTKTYQYYLIQVKAKREHCSELYVDIQNSKDVMFSQHD